MSSNFKPQPIFFVGRPSNAEEPKPEMDTAQQPMFEPDLNVLEAIKETLKSQIKCDLSFESTLFQDPAITDIMTSVPSDDSFALNAPYVTRAADQTAYIKKAADENLDAVQNITNYENDVVTQAMKISGLCPDRPMDTSQESTAYSLQMPQDIRLQHFHQTGAIPGNNINAERAPSKGTAFKKHLERSEKRARKKLKSSKKEDHDQTSKVNLINRCVSNEVCKTEQSSDQNARKHSSVSTETQSIEIVFTDCESSGGDNDVSMRARRNSHDSSESYDSKCNATGLKSNETNTNCDTLSIAVDSTASRAPTSTDKGTPHKKSVIVTDSARTQSNFSSVSQSLDRPVTPSIKSELDAATLRLHSISSSSSNNDLRNDSLERPDIDSIKRQRCNEYVLNHVTQSRSLLKSKSKSRSRSGSRSGYESGSNSGSRRRSDSTSRFRHRSRSQSRSLSRSQSRSLSRSRSRSRSMSRSRSSSRSRSMPRSRSISRSRHVSRYMSTRGSRSSSRSRSGSVSRSSSRSMSNSRSSSRSASISRSARRSISPSRSDVSNKHHLITKHVKSNMQNNMPASPLSGRSRTRSRSGSESDESVCSIASSNCFVMNNPEPKPSANHKTIKGRFVHKDQEKVSNYILQMKARFDDTLDRKFEHKDYTCDLRFRPHYRIRKKKSSESSTSSCFSRASKKTMSQSTTRSRSRSRSKSRDKKTSPLSSRLTASGTIRTDDFVRTITPKSKKKPEPNLIDSDSDSSVDNMYKNKVSCARHSDSDAPAANQQEVSQYDKLRYKEYRQLQERKESVKFNVHRGRISIRDYKKLFRKTQRAFEYKQLPKKPLPENKIKELVYEHCADGVSCNGAIMVFFTRSRDVTERMKSLQVELMQRPNITVSQPFRMSHTPPGHYDKATIMKFVDLKNKGSDALWTLDDNSKHDLYTRHSDFKTMMIYAATPIDFICAAKACHRYAQERPKQIVLRICGIANAGSAIPIYNSIAKDFKTKCTALNYSKTS